MNNFFKKITDFETIVIAIIAIGLLTTFLGIIDEIIHDKRSKHLSLIEQNLQEKNYFNFFVIYHIVSKSRNDISEGCITLQYSYKYNTLNNLDDFKISSFKYRIIGDKAELATISSCNSMMY